MIDLNFQIRGKGDPIILIHGFPMTSAVWDSFAQRLSEDNRVITFDLPGFGGSPILKTPFTLSDVADQLLQLLSEKGITKSVLIGHSLGGYITLDMIGKNPERFAGFGLFHSTAYPDSAEKKQSRTKAIEFINKNGVTSFSSNFIAPLFVDQNHPAIETVRQIAIQSSAEAVKGYTVAMRDRPDLTAVIEKYNKPILFLAGAKDNGIPAETISKQSILAVHPEVHVLEAVAHMGMFENPSETVRIIKSFAVRCFQ